MLQIDFFRGLFPETCEDCLSFKRFFPIFLYSCYQEIYLRLIPQNTPNFCDLRTKDIRWINIFISFTLVYILNLLNTSRSNSQDPV